MIVVTASRPTVVYIDICSRTWIFRGGHTSQPRSWIVDIIIERHSSGEIEHFVEAHFCKLCMTYCAIWYILLWSCVFPESFYRSGRCNTLPTGKYDCRHPKVLLLLGKAALSPPLLLSSVRSAVYDRTETWRVLQATQTTMISATDASRTRGHHHTDVG